MNGNDDNAGGGDRPDLVTNEPDPKRARISKSPEISKEIIHEKTNDCISDTHEKETPIENTEKCSDELELEVPNEKYNKDDIEHILHYKVDENECKLYVDLKTSQKGWISHRHIDEIVLVAWLTKLSLNQERKLAPDDDAPISVIQSNPDSTNPDSHSKIDEILAREIEINKNSFIFDKDGNPRFVEKILGITKDMGSIEFVVKFKYLRQERLIEAKILNEQVPHIVISYYEERVILGSEKIHHYKVDNNQII